MNAFKNHQFRRFFINLILLVIIALFSLTAGCKKKEEPKEEEAPVVEKTYYKDFDGDGYGDAGDEGIPSPAKLAGRVEDNTDCNDEDATVHPGAEELCGDGIDQDCDGADKECPSPEEAAKAEAARKAAEEAKKAEEEAARKAAEEADEDGDGHSIKDGDCDDKNPDIYPGAKEICEDGIDQDCDGKDKECPTYYKDADGDGFGNPEESMKQAEKPEGYVDNNKDCNDEDAAINPKAKDICGDGIDQDCSGADTACFKKTLGGSKDDTGFSLSPIRGGYILLGSTESSGAGKSDMYLVKVDNDGNKKWEKTFGGEDSDSGQSVQALKDGFILLGSTMSSGAGKFDMFLIRTDSNGNEKWKKTFGGKKNDSGFYVQQTKDGGFILLGHTSSSGAGKYDFYLVKTDKDGNEQWAKTYGGEKSDSGLAVLQTADEGYILLGGTESSGAGKYDVYLVKTDKDGNEQWAKTYGGEKVDIGYSISSVKGGYILIGRTLSSGGGKSDVYLIKVDNDGNEVWNKTYDGADDDIGYSVQALRDGYIILGNTSSSGSGKSDMCLIRTDANGNEKWKKTFGGAEDDSGRSVRQTSDGGFILLGSTKSSGAGGDDMFLVKTDPDGNVKGD